MIIHLRIISRCCTKGKYSKIPGVTRDFTNNLHGTILGVIKERRNINRHTKNDHFRSTKLNI